MGNEHFEIRDKRRFREDTIRDEDTKIHEEKTHAHHQKEQAGKIQEKAEKIEAERPEDEEAPIPEVTFSSFIFSLARSAFMHLGEEPHPETGKVEISLPLAKETINIISILEEKTRGNLTPEEDQLIKNMLFALRMKYVEVATKKSK